MSETTHRRFALVGGVFVVACCLVVFWQGRSLAGHIGYTLDDAYIHLRVSEMIRSGHYGLEPGTAASPASSILWPFVLAPFASFSWQPVVPLIINLVCLGATVPVVAATLRRSWPDPRWHRWAAGVAVGTVVLANSIATAATGMEHTAQVLAVATMASGMVSATRGDRLRWWFWAAVVVGPLLRYETLLVSTVAVVVAFRSAPEPGDRRRALAAGGTVVTLLLAFSGFLLLLGLDALPSSILVKSRGGLSNVTEHGFLVPLLLVALIVSGARLRHVGDRPNLEVTVATVAVFAGHMVFATTDRLRYSTSITLLAFVAIAVSLPALLPTQRNARAAVAAALALLVVAPSVNTVVDGVQEAPDGIAQIAQQQCQLHELVVDHVREAVAANDIGCLAYRNPYPVLDLWGLASQRARELRLANAPNWVGTLVTEQRVHVAMIYDVWFPGEIPATWTLVARLASEAPGYSADTVVALYATDSSAVERLRAAVEAYDATPHPGTTIRYA